MADRIAEASSRQDVARAGVTALGEAAADIPFALLYLVEDGEPRTSPARVACTGVAPMHRSASSSTARAIPGASARWRSEGRPGWSR